MVSLEELIPSGYDYIAMGNGPFIDGLPIENGDFLVVSGWFQEELIPSGYLT